SLTFAPLASGTFSNAAVFISNGGNRTNSLVGVGLTPPQLSVSPSALDFGFVLAGSSAQANFVLTNLGSAPITNGTASLSDPAFTVLSGSPFSLPGFGSTTVTVRFAPPGTGSFSNVVAFTTANGGNTTNVVRGSGATPPVANFSAAPTLGQRPLAVSFTDTSSGTITNRFWDFGDGSTTNTSATAFTHNYSQANTYSILLTVTGP